MENVIIGRNDVHKIFWPTFDMFEFEKELVFFSFVDEAITPPLTGNCERLIVPINLMQIYLTLSIYVREYIW